MNYSFEKLTVALDFDLIAFMEQCHENKIEGQDLEKLQELWQQWTNELEIRKVTCNKIQYLALWLPESAETIVDQLWDEKPSQGFLANALAQYICMQAVAEVLPQVDVVGCAPAPKPTQTLRAALAELGLRYRDDLDVLERRFATVTLFPFKGGCEICNLQKECPKGSNGEADSSIVLPGFER